MVIFSQRTLWASFLSSWDWWLNQWGSRLFFCNRAEIQKNCFLYVRRNWLTSLSHHGLTISTNTLKPIESFRFLTSNTFCLNFTCSKVLIGGSQAPIAGWFRPKYLSSCSFLSSCLLFFVTIHPQQNFQRLRHDGNLPYIPRRRVGFCHSEMRFFQVRGNTSSSAVSIA